MLFYLLWGSLLYCCANCKCHTFVHLLLCLLPNTSSHYSHSHFHFGTSITFSMVTCNTLSLPITIISLITLITTKLSITSFPPPSSLLLLPLIYIIRISFVYTINLISIIFIINITTTIIINTTMIIIIICFLTITNFPIIISILLSSSYHHQHHPHHHHHYYQPPLPLPLLLIIAIMTSITIKKVSLL